MTPLLIADDLSGGHPNRRGKPTLTQPRSLSQQAELSRIEGLQLTRHVCIIDFSEVYNADSDTYLTESVCGPGVSR